MTGHDLAAPLTRLCRREFSELPPERSFVGSSRRMAPANAGKHLRYISSGSPQLHVEFARSREILFVIRPQEISYIPVRKIASWGNVFTLAFFALQR